LLIEGMNSSLKKVAYQFTLLAASMATALPALSDSRLKLGQVYPAEYKGVHAKIMAFAGVNTAEAKMIAVSGESNIIDFCALQRPPEQFRDCYKEKMRSNAGKRYTMQANCPAGIVKTHWNQQMQLIGKRWELYYGSREGRWILAWRDLDTGDIRRDASSGTYDYYAIHYLLCPDYHPRPSAHSVDVE